jgi:hypothetical protein
MKLTNNTTTPTELLMFETTEHTFKIDGENPFIFDLLRNKIYSDKIGSICREVASNAWDANKEADKYNTHIEIAILNSDNIYYAGSTAICFKDSGLGMSPATIANVYTNYGESTKRASNKSIGGFGLGCKSPFSYTDTFLVHTTCINDHGEVVKYEYNAIIDSTNKGKMLLINETVLPMGSPTGTEVIIPVQDADVATFESKVLHFTQLFTLKPKLVNFQRSFKDITIQEYKTFTYLPSEGTNVNLCISYNGIPYDAPIGSKFLENIVDIKELGSRLQPGTYYLKVKIGEISVAINREAVEVTPVTEAVLAKKYELFLKELQQLEEAYKASSAYQQFLTYTMSYPFKINYDEYYKSVNIKHEGVYYAGLNKLIDKHNIFLVKNFIRTEKLYNKVKVVPYFKRKSFGVNSFSKHNCDDWSDLLNSHYKSYIIPATSVKLITSYITSLTTHTPRVIVLKELSKENYNQLVNILLHPCTADMQIEYIDPKVHAGYLAYVAAHKPERSKVNKDSVDVRVTKLDGVGKIVAKLDENVYYTNDNNIEYSEDLRLLGLLVHNTYNVYVITKQQAKSHKLTLTGDVQTLLTPPVARLRLLACYILENNNFANMYAGLDDLDFRLKLDLGRKIKKLLPYNTIELGLIRYEHANRLRSLVPKELYAQFCQEFRHIIAQADPLLHHILIETETPIINLITKNYELNKKLQRSRNHRNYLSNGRYELHSTTSRQPSFIPPRKKVFGNFGQSRLGSHSNRIENS